MRKIRPRNIFVVWIVVFFAAFSGVSAQSPQDEARRVSLIELIARAKDFEGVRVQVYGTFVSDANADWLYSSREAARILDFASGIILSREKRTAHWREEWSGRSMMVEGRFHFSEDENRKSLVEITQMRPFKEPGEKKQPK